MNQPKDTKGMELYTVNTGNVDLAVERATNTCKLCLVDCHPSQMYSLWSCGCSFCLMCIEQYLSVLIYDGSVLAITCPDGQCPHNGLIGDEEIATLVKPNIYDRYKRMKFLREVESDPQKVFCPVVGCETVCDVCTVTNNPTPVTCPKCGFLFCHICKASWHLSKSCDEAMRSSENHEDEGIPFTSIRDDVIKRCPLCHIPIERNDGCAQMMCKQCKHIFCWYCLASLDDDFMLQHYDKGPCKNRLGHSRASLIWHRTQVVGIFAGFGILLLVASPFLLLAAPCILCCKCKICKCCDEDDEVEGFTSS